MHNRQRIDRSYNWYHGPFRMASRNRPIYVPGKRTWKKRSKRNHRCRRRRLAIVLFTSLSRLIHFFCLCVHLYNCQRTNAKLARNSLQNQSHIINLVMENVEKEMGNFSIFEVDQTFIHKNKKQYRIGKDRNESFGYEYIWIKSSLTMVNCPKMLDENENENNSHVSSLSDH